MVCGAETEVQARKEIAETYSKMSKAFESKDAKGFESVFAENFTAKSPGRPPVGRAELFKDFEDQMKMMSNIHWTQTIKTIKLQGNVAHVGIESKMQATMPGPDKKQHNFLLTSKTFNDWVKAGSTWKVRSGDTSELKMWVDGKQLNQNR